MFLSNLIGFVGSILFVFVGLGSCGCDNHLYVPPSGVIYSPKYPKAYTNNTYCMWHIQSRETGSTISLTIDDLDIESDSPEDCGYSGAQLCCKHNWLSVPLSGSGKVKTQQLCGTRTPSKPILVDAPELAIKLHISEVNREARGFRISYGIVTGECKELNMVSCGFGAGSGCFNNLTERCDGVKNCDSGLDEASCLHCPLTCRTDRKCYSQSQQCNGHPDCSDFSDEFDCGFCEKGKILCSPATHHCFHPETEHCDGKFDCPWGEDEVGCVPGCENKIACSSGEGCYSSSQRCDSLSDCLDLSDENMCPHELCVVMHDKRQCHNGHCLPARLWCDGTDDCGDNSDEEACLKNSIIALAIMGSLFCGLLLVVAVGCAFRIYGHRMLASSNYHLHISPHLASRLRMTSVSLPTLVDDDFFLREPPPAYSVAMGETDINIQHIPIMRPRRQRRQQRLRHVPPPQVVAKPPDPLPCDASSSQSSPSRGSVTSSSYVSGTDDTVLLSS